MKSKSFVLSFAVVLASVPALAAPAGINQLFVFGDSLSDTGNAAIALGGSIGGNYAPNEFTDGANTTPPTTGPFGLWIEQFAAKTGFSDPTPYLANPLNTTNVNYAVGSATVEGSELQDLSSQLSVFGAGHLGGAPSNALYTFWAGGNDVLNGNANGAGIADALEGDISTLAKNGAKYFMWLNLPPLGATPDVSKKGNTAVAAANAASTAFDTEWMKDIQKLDAAGITIIGVDVASLFNDIVAGKYGFTNTTSPAQGTSGNPNNYVFWDGEHPTTATDALIAGLAYSDYQAAFATTSVPEPSALFLTVAGLGAAFAIRRKRRQRG